MKKNLVNNRAFWLIIAVLVFVVVLFVVRSGLFLSPSASMEDDSQKELEMYIKEFSKTSNILAVGEMEIKAYLESELQRDISPENRESIKLALTEDLDSRYSLLVETPINQFSEEELRAMSITGKVSLFPGDAVLAGGVIGTIGRIIKIRSCSYSPDNVGADSNGCVSTNCDGGWGCSKRENLNSCYCQRLVIQR